jgi:hypothetical protein
MPETAAMVTATTPPSTISGVRTITPAVQSNGELRQGSMNRNGFS